MLNSHAHQKYNSAILSMNRELGVSWNHAMWIATVTNFNIVPDALRALFYEAQRGGNLAFIDDELRPLVKAASSAEELLNNLDYAGCHGWIVLVKLPCRMYKESGDFDTGYSTEDHWFYAHDLDTLIKNVNIWSNQRIEIMKQNNFISQSQRAIKETMLVE